MNWIREAMGDDRRDRESLRQLLIVGTLGAIVIVGLWLIESSFEAHAYNHATGSNVSVWDAMWLDLRVQAEPRR